MCESKVFLMTGDEKEHVMSEVVRMEVVDGGVRLFDIIGNETFVEGAMVRYADLMTHEIVLEK